MANLAFIALVAEAIYWPDLKFFQEFLGDGHPIVGYIPDVGIYPLKTREVIQKELKEFVSASVAGVFISRARSEGWLDRYIIASSNSDEDSAYRKSPAR